MPDRSDVFGARETVETPLGPRTIYRLDALKSINPNLDRLPCCIKVLLECCLRNMDGHVVTEEHVRALAGYDPSRAGGQEVPFRPRRVLLQDFTGVPAVVDLAAMRAAVVRLGGDPKRVNPLAACDLVIDHSLQVDAFGQPDAMAVNNARDFERNGERYRFLKWGQQAFNNFRVVPPGAGICHQVNLEYLARVVGDDGGTLLPDSLVGTDSHTTMINGLGVLGWGVGGIEAEAVMLGQPIYLLVPQVVGLRLVGSLPPGCTATDLVLAVTQLLRAHGVVDKFVEFFGPGLDDMAVATRATLANMAPEYGATVGFFPVDEQTVRYLALTGRDDLLVGAVEQYCRLQGLWRDERRQVRYSTRLELDLGSVQPSLAGPRRPQDRVDLANMKAQWRKDLATGFGKSQPAAAEVQLDGARLALDHGSVVIASITSCTNTSNPAVMVGAGLLAKRAVDRGLARKPWVKTSLAPGSRVVADYLTEAGLMAPLEALGFHLVGYGCATCIGNSGPLPAPVSQAIAGGDLVAAAVLSGNRNFEGRIHADVKANYLASPLLVVAYAIAGTVDIDLTSEPLAADPAGRPVYLKDLWPTPEEIDRTVARCVSRRQFVAQYANVFAGSDAWQAIDGGAGELFHWDEASTYVQEPPFFANITGTVEPIGPIRSARCLVKLGDSVTTDHISPAGSIRKDSTAGRYLIDHGVSPAMFNSYGARRGNDRVMVRGTFANVRVRNELAGGREGGFTLDFTDGQVKSIFDASESYRRADVPLIGLAGRDYGMGSSRDWAAKGPFLLGIRAVIAESFERIHRSNLVGMGILPLCYQPGQSARSLGLTGHELFDIDLDDSLRPGQDVPVVARRPDGREVRFAAACRIDTPVEIDYYRHGGILHYVLRAMAK